MANRDFPAPGVHRFATPHYASEMDEDNLGIEPEHADNDSRFANGPDHELMLPRFTTAEREHRIRQVESELRYLLALRDGNHRAAQKAGEAWFAALHDEGEEDG